MRNRLARVRSVISLERILKGSCTNMPIMTRTDLHAWWVELRHSGMVVAPALLDQYFSGGPEVPKRFSYQQLRERYAAFETWAQQKMRIRRRS